ncbi:MAG: PilZ domain-containing protein [Bryobacteraceae bacterium]|nr:PilZ domain-containing protein [Bryobacteraceae bacterium]MDW8379855.1 PilZ domain-containing protein [Bryobacterales bacterium]
MLANLTKLAQALLRAEQSRKTAPFVERRSEPRLWCSELVEVWQKGEKRWKRIGSGVLEDISPSGACLQLESPVSKGVLLRFKAGNWMAEGEVRYCFYRDIGYYAGLKLGENFKWSETVFQPKHLVDPRQLGKSPLAGEAADGEPDPSG